MTTTADTTETSVTAATAAADAPNVAAESAGGADTGPADSRHATDHGTGGDSAGTGEPAGRARRLAWLDPRTLAVHPRNVRDDLGDISGLAASIAAQGVLEALTVIPHTSEDGEPGFLLVAGHRRAAAAVLAGADAVPCVVRPDLADPADRGDGRDGGERAAAVGQVAAMLAENLHRRGLSAVEEARGVQTMLNLGATLTTVAKSTGLGRKRVAKAAGVARLDDQTAAAVSAAGLTLDQAAAVAVFADDPATAAALVDAAAEGPGRFAHALTRAKQAKDEAEQTARLAGELAAAGRTVLDQAGGERATPISRLAHDGQPLTAETHAGCPAAAVHLAAGWDGPRAVEVCTDPAAHGHTSRWPSTPLPGGDAGDGGGEPTEDEREAAAAARRGVIEGNKAMAAANQTRREWVKALLQRRTAPRAALRFAVDTLAADPRTVARWLSGQPNAAQEQAAADLGLAVPGQWRPDGTEAVVTLTSGEPLPDARLTVALLAHVAAAIESGIDRQTWRNPSAGDARWLRFLAGAGYTVADIEQQIIDRVPQGAGGTDDADPAAT